MLSALACLLVQTSVQGPEATGIPAAEGAEVTLFDGRTLAGWRQLGDAVWNVEPGAEGEPFELVGAVGGGSQSFLVSERSFGDFRLELDVKTELPGNSGIQIRSREDDAGRLVGYQVEIDPSERAWSGGLYDEARRGWLQDLAGRDEARAAFQPGEWNHYVIECRGPRIRTWIDGVAITDWLDPLDLEGQLGLQVHSGDDTRVRFRELRLVDLGRHAWRPVSELIGQIASSGPGPRWSVAGGDACGGVPCSVQLSAFPERLAVRWSWDPERHDVGFQLGSMAVGTSRQRVLVARGGGEETALDPAGGAPAADGLRRLALIRSGPRVCVFVDGVRALDVTDFEPGPGARAWFANYRSDGPPGEGLHPFPATDLEVLAPLP